MPISQAQLTQDLLSPLASPWLANGALPPTLWSQLEPRSQQQLAQQIAELIWRIRQTTTKLEGSDHEQA